MTAPFATLSEFRDLLAGFAGPDMASVAGAKDRNGQLTKPPGALGRLEDLAIWYAGWRGRRSISWPKRLVQHWMCMRLSWTDLRRISPLRPP